MSNMQLTTKPLKTALAIAAALNHVKAGTGDTYMLGYASRRITESLAQKAIRGGYDHGR